MRSPLQVALLPAMRSWERSRASRNDDLPVAQQLHSDGQDSDRLLVLGSGPGVGWGAGSHDLALSGGLGRAITSLTGRGTDIDVVSRPSMMVRSAAEALRAIKLWRYDAIVIALGFSDALDLVSLREWSSELSTLLTLLSSESSSSTRIVVAGLPQVQSLPGFAGVLGAVANRQAQAMDRSTARVCDDFARATFVSLQIKPGENYSLWAGALAELVAPLLQSDLTDPGRDPRLDLGFSAEVERQQAVDDMGLIEIGPDGRFDSVVTLAKEIFGTDGAVFGILDGNREMQLSHSEGQPTDVLRSTSFCAITIQHRGAMVVPDTRLDPRFSNNPAVLGDPHVRFYAGFPIESLSGEPIGALCVFDRQPRSRDLVDEALLRSMALLIQGELQRNPVAAAAA